MKNFWKTEMVQLFDYSAFRSERMKAGVTMDQVCEVSGLSKSYLCDIELGRRNATLETGQRLVKALKKLAGA